MGAGTPGGKPPLTHHGPFLGPKLKIERAKRHVADLDSEIRAFLDRKPYRVVVEADAKGEQHRLTFRACEEVPLEFATYIGDAIHNLRAALDHLACDLVRLSGKSTNGVYFPFAYDANSLKAAIKDKKIHRAGKDIVSIIWSLKPYKGGNDALRAIHDLDVMDKHKILIPVSNIVDIPAFSALAGKSGVIFSGGVTWLAPKNGNVLVAIPSWGNLKLDQEFDPSIIIAFGEGQPFKREAVVPTLLQLVELTNGIVQAFEAHCFGTRAP